MKILILGATGRTGRLIVEESSAYFPYFPGHVPVTMNRVTQAYVKSVLGGQTGQIYKVL